MQIGLGDVRAEQDRRMLERAFYASPDYKTLIETEQKSLVVGRRGTGKSALFLKLSEHFSKVPKGDVLLVAPEEPEVLALKYATRLITTDFRTARVLVKLAFRCAIGLELASRVVGHYKSRETPGAGYLQSRLKQSGKRQVFSHMRMLFQQLLARADLHTSGPIACMLELTDLSDLEHALNDAVAASKRQFAILVDRTDEGFEPDDLGVAIVDGICNAVIETQDRILACRAIVFLRDNIFRSLQKGDPDFSRNLEQAVLRLHWDENALFSFICSRIRIATNSRAEKDLRIWNQIAINDLEGKDGFRKCLRLTLYRPRDLLLLVNEAFRKSAAIHAERISGKEISASAMEISKNRLADLEKEYSNQFPGLQNVLQIFEGTRPEWEVGQVCEVLNRVMQDERLAASIVQHFRILSLPRNLIKDLFSIGFLGIRDKTSGNFVYCHDGRSPDKQLDAASTVLIHPCYWMALGLSTEGLDEDSAEEIYDEYDVTVVSETPTLRDQRIGQIEQRLQNIPLGSEGAVEFEDWCHEALRIAFAGALANIELKPNKSNLQRRDIVATNLCDTSFWKRVRSDYGTSQVVFEVKNYKDLGADEFRQVLSYTGNEYGKFAVMICRRDDLNLGRDRELRWIREVRNQQGVVVLVLNASFICKLLHKLRSPKKHSDADKKMSGLLDQYLRIYFNEPAYG